MKEKIKEHIKKHKILYSAILIFLCFWGIEIIVSKLIVTDELFTFANVFKLHNGIQLYSQNNIIDTPLFFYLANVFLSIFGMNFFVYKVLGLIMFEIIFILILNILRKLKIPVSRAVIYIILIILPFSKNLYENGANYNILALIFWLLGMYLIIKNDKFEVKPIQQGIVSALIFATKQNVGMYYLIGLTLCVIYLNRKDIKKILKKLFATYSVFIVITAIWIIALAIQGQLKDFINYCFLGMGDFATRNIYVMWEFAVFYLIPILTIIGLIIAKKKFNITTENKVVNTSIVFLCFMVPSMLIGYPIFNEYHVELAMLISVVYSTYILEQLVIRLEDVFYKRIVKIILALFVIVILLINICFVISYIKYLVNDNNELTYNDPYFGMVITPELKDKLNEIVNFVKLKNEKNQDVIIFSSEANMYRIKLKQNYQDFDLPFLGNWGYKGEERILNEIKGLKNTFILVKDEDIIGQESKKIKEYIKNNYNKTGEVADFEIYYIE